MQNKLQQKSNLHYLPVVEADHATVMRVLQSSIDMADLLKLDAMVVLTMTNHKSQIGYAISFKTVLE